MRILLIDDDPLFLSTARRLLERAGIEVVLHEGAFNATNALSRHQPDLVLVDVNMPFLSGDQLVPLFAKQKGTRYAPVVFFSSNDEQSLRELVRNTGAAGYLMKSALGADFAQQVWALYDKVRYKTLRPPPP